MKASNLPDEIIERAVAYALGALAPDEAAAFAQELAGDIRVADSVDEFRQVVNALACIPVPVEPSASLRERLLENLGPQDAVLSASEVSLSDRVLVRASEGEWNEVEPGVRVKVLYKDESRQTLTTLVRMNAGARIPRHFHEGAEECYVIAGDIYDDHIAMNAGDYISLMKDTMHSFVSTINGAELLIIAPLGHYEAAI